MQTEHSNQTAGSQPGSPQAPAPASWLLSISAS